MDIKVIRLRNICSKNKEEVIDSAEHYFQDLNFALMEKDLTLVEAKESEASNIFIIESGGVENMFITRNLIDKSTPIYLLPTKSHNSLAACFEIKTYLDSLGYYPLLILGNIESNAYYLEIISKTERICQSIVDNNLGLIGGSSSWLIGSTFDKDLIKEVFKLNIIDISLDELYQEIEKHEYEETFFTRKIKTKTKKNKTLNEALYIYGALKRLVKKYNLKGLTIKCFDLLEKYHNTACVALSLLNDEGIVSGCEGDIPSLISMYFAYLVAGFPCFMANPSDIFYQNKTLLLSHCSCPTMMCKSFSLATHFESDEGLAIQGEMKVGSVTLFKIAPNLKDIILAPAEAKEVKTSPFHCRTQIEVSLEDDFFRDIKETPFGNHLILIYGNYIIPLLNLFERFNLALKQRDNS